MSENDSIARRFEAAADRRPEAIAVDGGGDRLSYAELDARANRLARRLRALGVTREQPVGVCLDRTPELIVSLLAVLKAGGAYVPLDPELPDERLALLQRDCALGVVIGDGAAAERLRAHAASVVRLDAERDAIAAQSPARLDGTGGDDRLAYLMFTSGSTGAPKAVAVEQRAIARLVLATNYVTLGPADRVAQGAHASFDGATFEIWGALLNGATLVILPTQAMIDPPRLAEELRRHGITTLFLATALFHHTARLEPGAFAGVRQLLVGGDALDPLRARAVLDAGPPARLINAYGPTETTTFSLFHDVDAAADAAAPIPIGRSITGDSAFILDEDGRGREVAGGEPGELYLGGAGLARGYWRRPELTAERFVPHPFARGERLYRTGDRARRRADGAIEFLGRLDRQVKLRGVRIEPGEVEAALRRHPGVADALVAAEPLASGDRRLVAWVVPSPSGADERALHDFLERTLPRHAVPSAIVLLARFPLNASGKLDRDALPPPPSDVAPSPSDAAPRGALEETLAQLWRDVLAVPRVGRAQGFFELGGDSLRAGELVVRARRELGLALSIQDLLSAPTVRGLAELLEQRGHRPIARIPRRADRTSRPVAPSLERNWRGTEVFAHPLLRGPLDVAALERAVHAIETRHEVLRATFFAGEPWTQRIAPPVPRAIPVEDLRAVAEPERTRRAFDAVVRLQRPDIDLSVGPLFRVALVRLADEEHVLALEAPHLIFDAASVGVFFAELDAAYRAFASGVEPRLPDLAIDYADYAAWQRRLCADPEGDAQRAYWRRLLHGVQAMLLPADRPRAPVEARRAERPGTLFAAGAEWFELEPPLRAALTTLARANGTTLQTIVLAAYLALLHRWSGAVDLALATSHANRDRDETRALIGAFASGWPLRIAAGDDPTFADLAQRVHRALLAGRAHTDVPDNLIQVPPLRVSFNFHPEVELRCCPLAVETWPPPPPEPPKQRPGGVMRWFDLALIVWSKERGLGARLRYNAELFEAATIARLVARFRSLLETVVAAPERRLSALIV